MKPISYGTDPADTLRLVGLYAGGILQRAKLADLPIDRSTKFEPLINRKTAEALGLMMPPWLLTIADKVIE
jgi:putative ABC transport system substrate-binding protein